MLRALRKMKGTGELYVRPPRIARILNKAVSEEPLALREHCRLTDPKAPDYLPSECLVYLFRDAKRREDDDLMNLLVLRILERCKAILDSKVPDSHCPNAADLREEVLGRFGVLLAEDGTGENQDELDFFECRFNLAFQAFRFDILRKEVALIEGSARLPDDRDDDGPEMAGDPLAEVCGALRMKATQEGDARFRELADAVEALPEDERNAVRLRYLGYEVESEDPNKRTVATICGVKGRTIRNRLHRAAEKLSKFKEDLCRNR